MKGRQLTFLVACFIGFVLVAGCTTQDDASIEASSQNGLLGLDLKDPPTDLKVSVSAQKDPLSNIISVTFDGGFGQDLVSSVLVGVTLSDGRVETQKLPATKGSTITFKGTTGMDVVEAVVSYMNGESYKIYHESLQNLKRGRI